VTGELTAHEEESVGMGGNTMVHVGRERDINRVIPVRRTVWHIDKQSVFSEGKAQPKVLLWVRRRKGCTKTVGNGVLDINCNSTTGKDHMQRETPRNQGHPVGGRILFGI